jgi:fucose permease
VCKSIELITSNTLAASRLILNRSYAANFFGWLTAAFANTHLSLHLDLGALLVLGAALQIAAQALRAWTTPFPLFVVTFWLTSIGQAFQDTHANSYVAGAGNGAHRWLGFIHAMYMAGCLVAPFAVSPIASAQEPSVWYLFYILPAGLGFVNLLMCLFAFRDTVRLRRGPPGSASNTVTTGADASSLQDKTASYLIKKTLKQSSLWYISVFFFFYLGMTLTASGWVVEYLVDVRDGDLERVSYVPAGFSGGCLLGRLLLPEPTHRYGERLMGTIYLAICLGVQLVFWL